jgi:hypothetical protein
MNTPEVTEEDRMKFLDLMVEVKGLHFMVGWLKSCYASTHPKSMEDAVMLSYREQLLADKLAGNVHDVHSNMVIG